MKKYLLIAVMLLTLIVMGCVSTQSRVVLYKNSIQMQKFDDKILYRIALDIADCLELSFSSLETKILLNTSITQYNDFDIFLNKAIRKKGFLISTATLVHRGNSKYRNISYLLDSFNNNSIFLYLYVNHSHYADFFYTKDIDTGLIIKTIVRKA